jgi:hypothetical protein
MGEKVLVAVRYIEKGTGKKDSSRGTVHREGYKEEKFQ